MARPVTFLSDYGLADEFVGVVHAVIARACPAARVIDLTHGIPRHDVVAGALALERALPYTPPGVHLAVVDPGVGGRRRAIAVRTAAEDRLLVGPDNGLLTPAAERFGGVTEAVEISRSPWRLEPVSATFHGRDVFAPVAARLAAGEPLAGAGAPLDPAELITLDRSSARFEEDGTIVAHAVATDGYGNVLLDLPHEALAAAPAWLRLGRPVRLEAGGRAAQAVYGRTFADVGRGELLVYEDATRALAVALNTGDAAATLGVAPGDELRLTAP
jgi:S-adenosyl-L-methionine hydrolase (adenosine-forming)